MPPLPTDLRRTLENAIIAARRAAEEAARASLTTLAVARPEPFATMDEPQRQLRRGLRAKARQLGDDTKSESLPGAAPLPLLTHEVAYEQWHRMLFARFLAENDLLMHPSGVAVSLADCAELATEEGAALGAGADAWDLAARYASAMLPGIFLADDPAVQVRFAAEGRQKLEAVLAGLPPAVFTADDGLGWVYQFWQTDKKKEVNASGRKIGGADLAPVTQLFTEDYMVRFLLENSLGAWWAARHPDSPLVREWRYLRWRENDESANQRISDDTQYAVRNTPSRVPAAGAFPGWPDRAAAITCMDPCGGSGHFVVAEFDMLRKMRMEEEGLDASAAGDAVIRDNLFMLELDPRCTQIATFALALAAWKAGGYRPLPTPNIACSGIAVTGQLEDWLRLAHGDERLQTALERLHKLFTNAPTLGSLINPADVPLAERMFTADYEEVAPLLEKALAKERDDPAAAVLGAAAEGVAKAAKLLAGQYTLVATNVPYLARGKQSEAMCNFCQRYAPEGKNDLATVFLERCLDLCTVGGTTSLVLPQNWLFLTTYHQFREKLLKGETWHLIARLGPQGFQTPMWDYNVQLITLSRRQAPTDQFIRGLDVSTSRSAAAKAAALLSAEIKRVGQWRQLQNPDARVTLEEEANIPLLEKFAESLVGLQTSDDPRFITAFWEHPDVDKSVWEFLQSTPESFSQCDGLSWLVRWEQGKGDLLSLPTAYPTKGLKAIGKLGIAIHRMQQVFPYYYGKERFHQNVAVIIPRDPAHFPAIWCFCSSREYSKAVRRVDQSLKVTNATLVKIPFDQEYWTQVAQERYPDGIPEPHSNDPTQWLFGGHPVGATDPPQVAVARLLGYRWPQQADDAIGAFADADGIVCLPAVGGEAPAAKRLRTLLAAVYGAAWSAAEQERLLASVGFTGKTLEDWTRFRLLLANRFSLLVGDRRLSAGGASSPVARRRFEATSDGSVGVYTPKASR